MAQAPLIQEEWLQEFNEPRPVVPLLWGWCVIGALVSIHLYWVSQFTDATVLSVTIGDMTLSTVQTFLLLQIVGLLLSLISCNYLFPKFPTVFGIPFILIGLTPPALFYVVPFLTPFGKEFSESAPLWCLTIWGTFVRCFIESTIQLHAAYGVKGTSYWLKWPIQKVPEPYTMTYPFINLTVTRTHGGNFDAFSSFFVALPIALITFFVDDDSNAVIIGLNWAVQIWMIIYLFVGPFLNFFMGMPGPNNIFDGKCEPKAVTQMHALTSGTLGTVAYMMGTYAIIHFLCFLRKMAF